MAWREDRLEKKVEEENMKGKGDIRWKEKVEKGDKGGKAGRKEISQGLGS